MGTGINLLDKEDDFVQNSLDRLPYQFENAPNMNQMVEVWANNMKEMSDKSIDYAIGTMIDNATGVNLIEIGKQMKVPDTGQTEEEYRGTLKLHTLSLVNSGTRDDIMNILQVFSGDPDVVFYHGYGFNMDVVIFTWCLGGASNGQQIADLFPLCSDLRILSRGRGYTFGFQDSFKESYGFDTVNIIIPQSEAEFTDTTNWTTAGGGVSISSGQLLFSSCDLNAGARYTSTNIKEENTYSVIVDVASISGSIRVIAEGGTASDLLTVGRNEVEVVTQSGNTTIIVYGSVAGATAVIDSVFIFDMDSAGDELTYGTGGFASLIYQSGGYGALDKINGDIG